MNKTSVKTYSGNRIVKNSFVAILYEFIAIISGLIIPRLILSRFGSGYNGIVSSVSQFLSFVVLLRAGIGGVAKTHLYKSLSDNDNDLTSQVMHASKDYMDKVCLVFLSGLAILSCIYPLIVSLPWASTALLVAICGISSLAENYFGITNMILLQADRKEYVISIGNIIATVLNVIFSVILIKLGFSIHVVKFGTAIAFSINPIFLCVYNKLHYNIDYQIDYPSSLLDQKKDAFIHVVAEFVHRNTDIIVLTVLTNTLVVSVYSVHAIVFNGLRKLTLAFTSNIESVLGRLYVSDDKSAFDRAYLDFEYVVFMMGSFVYCCCSILLPSFINIYTAGVNDINYVIPLYAILASVGEFFDLVKTPYQFVIRIAGKFKETKVISVIEAILNLVISTLLVKLLGLVGVAIGTLVAMLWRLIAYSYYVHKEIINRIKTNSIKYILFAGVIYLISNVLHDLVFVNLSNGILEFVIQAVFVIFVIIVSIVLLSLLFFRPRMINAYKSLKTILYIK